MPTTPEPFLTPGDVAKIAGVSYPTVLRWLHDLEPASRLPSYRPGDGARILIDRVEFMEWLRRQPVTGKRSDRQTTGGRVRAERAAAGAQ